MTSLVSPYPDNPFAYRTLLLWEDSKEGLSFHSCPDWERSLWGFPGVSDEKESAHNVGNPDLIPGLGRSPGEGNGYPLQYSCLENSTDRGAWRATDHGDCRESDMTGRLTLSLLWDELQVWSGPVPWLCRAFRAHRQLSQDKPEGWVLIEFCLPVKHKQGLFPFPKKTLRRENKKNSDLFL